MIKKFKIYLKDGQIIELEMQRFKLQGQQITFYDKYDEVLENSFILFDEVAAIIPAKTEQSERSERSERFNIYLRRQKEPVEITAYDFEINESSEISFRRVNFSNHKSVLENLFIALSEVIAILPAGALAIAKYKTE